MVFQREVHHRLGFWFWAQHKKALGYDFGNVSCWMFGQKMKGMEDVRWNGKTLKFGGFIGHVENLKFGMRFGCLGILDMIYMKFRPGF